MSLALAATLISPRGGKRLALGPGRSASSEAWKMQVRDVRAKYLGAIACLALCVLPPTQAQAATASVPGTCFRVTNGAPPNQPDQTFVVRLESQAAIQQARQIVSGGVTDKVHVQGFVKIGRVDYNGNWGFYLAPKSISFFTFAPPICGRALSTTDVEQLIDAGKRPTPSGSWCPWRSKVVAELPPGSDCADRR